MGNGNKIINVIHKITTFKYVIRQWWTINAQEKQLYDSKNKARLNQSDILLTFYSSSDEYMEFGIQGRFSDINRHSISWHNIENTFIEYLSIIFDLQLKINQDGNKYVNIIDANGNNYPAFLAIKRNSSKNNFFMVIFYYDDGESRRSSELYVQGIWEVELSEEFKETLLKKH
jgi:hypothetical protein